MSSWSGIALSEKNGSGWRDMTTAPHDGTPIRLLLKDGYGEYPFAPCSWHKMSLCWVSDKTCGTITVKVVGWKHLKEKG